jgi:hypothetical protein
MKNNSVKADVIDWKQLQKNALVKASNINNGNQLGAVMRYIYQSIDDFMVPFFTTTVHSSGSEESDAFLILS